jgi:VIT1/CCC1 family predicted Fe2+/Mn2+ transporter
MASPDASPGTTRPAVGPDAVRALRLVGEARRRVLDPVDRFAEATFGLIMVLTFTGALRVAEAGQQEVKDMLVAALGCNVAWGLVDGVMYLVTSLAARARVALVHRGIRTSDPSTARDILLGALHETVAAAMEPSDADHLVARIRALPAPPRRVWITLRDLRGAVASCLLVFLATFPPTLPYMFLRNLGRAQLVSEGTAVVFLFLAGYALGKKTGIPAGLLGAAMVVVGAGLVALTIALGG